MRTLINCIKAAAVVAGITLTALVAADIGMILVMVFIDLCKHFAGLF
jgi:hypothetical protein